ncbi:MAG: hypothetical protein OXC62_06845 [Aestuariivita sp.]|nr:hypothetical protein [Aestuariivita sp.]
MFFRYLLISSILFCVPFEASSCIPTGTGVDASGDAYARMVFSGEGGGRWNVTNAQQESITTGAFQFTY